MGQKNTTIGKLKFGENIFHRDMFPIPNSPNSIAIFSQKDLYEYIEDYLQLKNEETSLDDIVLISTDKYNCRSIEIPRLTLRRTMAANRIMSWYAGGPVQD